MYSKPILLVLLSRLKKLLISVLGNEAKGALHMVTWCLWLEIDMGLSCKVQLKIRPASDFGAFSSGPTSSKKQEGEDGCWMSLQYSSPFLKHSAFQCLWVGEQGGFWSLLPCCTQCW